MTAFSLSDFEALDAATLHEASGRRGALPREIKPVAGEFRVLGGAYPVLSPPADNLWLHHAILRARPGDVLVVSVGGHFDCGYWGEIMSAAAQLRQLGGLVIDGCVRDLTALRQVGFPVFARGLCIRGTGKDPLAPGSLNAPVLIGDVLVKPGDLVLGDTDGVVIVDAGEAAAVLRASKARQQEEISIQERLRAGETTLGIYNLPTPVALRTGD